jgi:hypothetical protein
MIHPIFSLSLKLVFGHAKHKNEETYIRHEMYSQIKRKITKQPEGFVCFVVTGLGGVGNAKDLLD